MRDQLDKVKQMVLTSHKMSIVILQFCVLIVAAFPNMELNNNEANPALKVDSSDTHSESSGEPSVCNNISGSATASPPPEDAVKMEGGELKDAPVEVCSKEACIYLMQYNHTARDPCSTVSHWAFWESFLYFLSYIWLAIEPLTVLKDKDCK